MRDIVMGHPLRKLCMVSPLWIPRVAKWRGRRLEIFFFFFFLKINFITSKQTITITRTVQLLMHNAKSDEEMDYKKRITEGVEPNRP